MLYQLLYPLHELIFVFNIFRYITFRAAMAATTAFLISLIFGPMIIRKLKELKIAEKIGKEDSKTLDDLHRHKQGTPTMGGLIILLSIVVATLLWADIFNKYVVIALFSTLWLGATGFADDYLKLTKKRPKGLTATAKFTSQIILGLILGTVLFLDPQVITKIDVPFLKDISWDLGIFYILFVIIVIAGTSNAVNLTDGLDGLAIGTVVMAAVAFSILSYICGNIKFSNYLLIPYLPGSGEFGQRRSQSGGNHLRQVADPGAKAVVIGGIKHGDPRAHPFRTVDKFSA